MLAFPSLDEGFGIPLLEAMAHGLPIIASKRAALPEVCGDAALLVDPNRTEEIAAAMQAIASDEKLGHRLTALGLARACQFSWETAVEKTWSVYNELI
jgi:glycosyltransferase involved in cell wall biosynthesis